MRAKTKEGLAAAIAALTNDEDRASIIACPAFAQLMGPRSAVPQRPSYPEQSAVDRLNHSDGGHL